VFRVQQDRTKRLLSKLLTAFFLKELCRYEFALEIIQAASFADTDIINIHLSGAELPTNRQIATALDITEQQASRSLANFLEKLRGNDKFAQSYDYMKVRTTSKQGAN
jgi:hypothetical protein